MKKNKINNGQPPINELIYFLDKFDSEKMSALRNEFIGNKELLSGGIILGEKSTSKKRDVSSELFVRGKVCQAWLKSAIKQSNIVLPKLKNKLQFLKNITITSQIVIGISGLSLLADYKDINVDFYKITVGLCSLVGSILTIIIQNKSVSFSGNNSLFQIYDNLVNFKIEGEQLSNELEVLLSSKENTSIDRLENIIKESNAKSIELRKLIEKI